MNNYLIVFANLEYGEVIQKYGTNTDIERIKKIENLQLLSLCKLQTPVSRTFID